MPDSDAKREIGKADAGGLCRFRRILVVEDDAGTRKAYVRYLRSLGYEVEACGTRAEVKGKVDTFDPEAIILDLMLPDGSSLELIAALRAADSEMAIVVITAVNDVQVAVGAMQRGADHYMVKPVRLEDLRVVLEKAAEVRGLRRTRTVFRRQAMPEEVFFGESARWRELRRQVELAADSDSVVLMLGETGAGKGVLARWIHDHSQRADGHFVELNCAALQGELLASELFGHVRGAFTTAVRDKPGLVEVASGGTLFLDEIGSMDLSLQAQLLNVIEEKKFRRVGDTRLRTSDFRLICATNQDLATLVAERKFREDLYFRINVFPIQVPSLREMRSDIPALCRHILSQLGCRACDLDPETLNLLCSYDWPGNIREVHNVLERALLLSRGGPIKPEHLPGLQKGEEAVVRKATTLREVELEHIRTVIRQCNGNLSAAARMLGISRATLYRRLRSSRDARTRG